MKAEFRKTDSIVKSELKKLSPQLINDVVASNQWRKLKLSVLKKK